MRLRNRLPSSVPYAPAGESDAATMSTVGGPGMHQRSVALCHDRLTRGVAATELGE